MRKKKTVGTFYVQSEFDRQRFYEVSLYESGREDHCECGGVIQYLGQKKNGEPKYRNQNLCFHIEWARKYAQPGQEYLRCG